jgi:hypothetical protein
MKETQGYQHVTAWTCKH